VAQGSHNLGHNGEAQTDPQTRHVHKTVHQRKDGYKAHRAVEPDTGLFTTGGPTQATGEDNHEAVVGLALLGDDLSADGLQVPGDSAYRTAEAHFAGHHSCCHHRSINWWP
jgi:hypothetical protein